jgi:ATP-dependent DNA helicase RecG
MKPKKFAAESTTVEWKHSLSGTEAIVETAVAFANTEGGRIFIGVSPEGKVVGVQIGKGTLEKLVNQIAQHTDPKLHPKVSIKNVHGKEMIVIEVKESHDHLVLAFGKPYKRVGRSTVKITKDEYERLILDVLKFISHAQLRLVKIKGVKIYGNILDRLDCNGALWEMVGQAEEFIRKNIRLLGFRTDKSFRREDKFEYPIKALREAIINGLIHRDYYNPADVRVFILDDRIEIVSPGSFPEGVSPEKPEHKPVNKILSHLMYDIGYIEKYGSGIYLENELCIKNGNEKPVYEITSNQTKVIFKSQVKDVTVVEIDKAVMSRLNESQRQFVRSGVKDISRKEYSDLVKCAIRTAAGDLKELLNKNIVKKIGGGKYVRYVVR